MGMNRTAALAEDLRRLIVEGTIAVGEKLPSESQLIAEHGVSRTVVREALGRLQAAGLIYSRRGSGSYALAAPPSAAAPDVSPGDRRGLLEFRVAVESEASALAAVRGEEETLNQLRQTLHAFEAARENPAAALEHDYTFHRGIAEASGNQYILDAITRLGPAMISMPRYRLASGAHDIACSEHRVILSALSAHDAVAASSAMRGHLMGSKYRLDGST